MAGRKIVAKSYLGKYGRQVVGKTYGKLGKLVGASRAGEGSGSTGVTIRKGRR